MAARGTRALPVQLHRPSLAQRSAGGDAVLHLASAMAFSVATWLGTSKRTGSVALA